MFKNGKRLYAGFLCGIAALFCGISGSIEVQASTESEIIETKTVTHIHTNNYGNGATIYSSYNPGGCFVAAGHTHNATGTCSTYSYKVTEVVGSHPCGCTHDSEYCGCGHGNHDGEMCDVQILEEEEVTKWDYNCGSPTNTWTIGCGKSKGQSIFKITLTKIKDNGNYVLRPTISNIASGTTIKSIIWNNGDSGDCNVTSNDLYAVTITYIDNGTTRTETVSYEVEDYKITISGTVSWTDNADKFETRPDSVTVTLFRDGEEIDSFAGLTEENNNIYSFPELPVRSDEDNHVFEYTTQLTGVYSKSAPEDKYVTTQTEYDFVNRLTNAYDPDNLDENDKGKGYYYSGNIYWQDKNDNLGYRPKNVTINFYREGNGDKELYKTASVDAFDQNYYEFTRLPKYYYDAGGEPYKYIYSAEEVFNARYVTTDYEVKAAYTIFPDTPQDFSFTNKFVAAGNVTGMKPDKEDDDSINIKTDTDDKIAINLKQMECVITEDGEIIFGDNYSGIEYNIVADKNGVRIDLPDGKYEINILDNRYSANDIIVVDTDNLKIVEENGKHYLIVGNTDRPDNNADKEAPDIKIDSEEKITVNLKQMEYIVNEDNSITFGDNYSGVEYNITVDKDGTPINIPDGKYEINIPDGRYSPEDIIILDTDRIQIVEENGKWYMIVGDMNQNETEPDIKIETDDKISINLKQMEFIVNEDGSISYGNNYSGLEFNITVDKDGTPINIPDGKYEINIPDGRYSPEDIIVLNNNKVTIVQEGDKWYMIVGDNNGNGNNGNGGITITTDKKENYEHRDSRSNFFSVTMIYI